MTRPRSAHRKVIEVSKPLHEELTRIKAERSEQLGRQVTFTEIINEWRVRSEGLDLLASHSRVRMVPSGP